jgi:hypothetical protein
MGLVPTNNRRRRMIFNKSFESIMSSFTKAKADLDKYVEAKEGQMESALLAAQRLVEVANDCCDEADRANKALKALNEIIG